MRIFETVLVFVLLPWKVSRKEYDANLSYDALFFQYDIDASNEKLGYKIRKSQSERIPTVVVIGQREFEEETVAVRYRNSKNQSILSLINFELDLIQQNKEPSS